MTLRLLVALLAVMTGGAVLAADPSTSRASSPRSARPTVVRPTVVRSTPSAPARSTPSKRPVVTAAPLRPVSSAPISQTTRPLSSAKPIAVAQPAPRTQTPAPAPKRKASPPRAVVPASKPVVTPIAPVAYNPNRKPVVILDSGHNPPIGADVRNSGAIGTCGKPEVHYNDETTADIFSALNEVDAYQVVMTRKPNEHRTLQQRSAIANSMRCDAFVAIHHDSTSAKNQRLVAGACTSASGVKSDGKAMTASFMNRYQVGYNIYVSRKSGPTRTAASMELARAVAKSLKPMGRPIANYHAIERDCPTCRDIDPSLGIMHQSLYVLNATKCPSILIEVGNIIDPTDEKAVNTPAFRKAFAAHVQMGLHNYFQNRARK